MHRDQTIAHTRQAATSEPGATDEVPLVVPLVVHLLFPAQQPRRPAGRSAVGLRRHPLNQRGETCVDRARSSHFRSMAIRRCNAVTKSGDRCRYAVRFLHTRCHIHRRSSGRVQIGLQVLLSVVVTTGTATALSLLTNTLYAIAWLVLGISVLLIAARIGARLSSQVRTRSVETEYRIANIAGAERTAEKLLSELAANSDVQSSDEDEANNAQVDSGDVPPAPAESDEDKQPSDGNITVNFFNNGDTSQLANLVREQSEGNAGLIVKYYAQGHRQASLSFTLSMLAATAGFVIAAGALIGYIRNPENLTAAVVTAVVSAVIELIGFLFFRRADNGRELMMQMIDRIRQDREQERNYIAALSALDQIESTETKDAMRVVAVLEFSKAATTLDQVAALLSDTRSTESAGSHPVVHIHGSRANQTAGEDTTTESG